MVAAGRPLMAYAPGGQALYPDANPPLSLVPLGAVEVLTSQLGWMGNEALHRAVTYVVFSLLVLLMAREAVVAVERLRGARLSATHRLLAIGLFALAPPAWQAVVGFGHVEQPLEIWLVLLAARLTAARRPASAGLAFGLALLSRSSAVLFWVPLVLTTRDVRWRGRLVLTAVGTATVVLLLLPFLLVDRADVVHSLVTYRGALGVGAGSIWSLLRGSPWEGVAQHLDLIAATILALALNAWLTTADGGIGGERLYAGLAISAASFAVLAKTVWPYYFFEVYVFVAIWVLARVRAGHLLDGVLALGTVMTLGLVAEIGSTTGLPLPQVQLEGAAMFLALSTALMLFTIRARRPVPG
jgi:uncharacterized membrane protein